MSRWAVRVILAIGLAATATVIVFPIATTIVQSVADPNPASGSWWPSARQQSLILRTASLSAMATALSIALSLPAAFVVGRSIHSRPGWLVAIVLMPLILSPMFLAFGWQRILGSYTPGVERFSQLARTIAIWSSWAWPVPALIIGSGWSRIGRPAYEAAVLDATNAQAFIRTALPTMWRHVLTSALILLAVFTSEYSVPHANGVMVVATEILSVAQIGAANEVIRLSAPIVAIGTVLLALAVIILRRTPPTQTDERPVQSPRLRCVPMFVVLFATIGVPLVSLCARSSLLSDLGEAAATYYPEWVGSIAVCLGSGVAAVLIGLFATTHRVVLWFTATGAVLLGIAPGAVVGEIMIIAYQNIGPIYDYWPILVIGLTARFAWLGIIVAWLAARSTSQNVYGQMSLDGSANPTSRLSLQLRHHSRILLAGVFVAGALAMADIPTVSMLQVPSPRMISLIIVEKFHRFETGMLVAISVGMLASVAPGAILIAIAANRKGP
jgi:ABC-type Fe3+ transport system permease subunit